MHAQHRRVEIIEAFTLDEIHRLRANAANLPAFLENYSAIRLADRSRNRLDIHRADGAQVNHVDEMPEKLQYDFYYVKNQGLLLDLMIIAWTVRTILSGAGR